MAVSNLFCRRVKDGVRISWAWTTEFHTASITLLRILDGAVLLTQQVSRATFDQAISSSQGGILCEAPLEPIAVRVADGNNSCEYELRDNPYVVEWRFVNKKFMTRRTLFSPSREQRVEHYLQLKYPCKVQAPEGMFYYTVSGNGSGEKENFRGVLPRLDEGMNTYGLLLPQGGRRLELHCDLQQDTGLAQLFQFRQLPDMEQQEEIR